MTGTVKLCECGCGEPAPVAEYTFRSRGWKKGEPKRFISGHNSRGDGNPNWSGGTAELGTGYVGVKQPDHPRAHPNGYVMEHVLIAERAIGKPLPASAEVHHVDGVRSNNTNANLVVCEDHAYHLLLHQRQRAVDACGHAAWRKCTYCKQYDEPGNLTLQGRIAYHRSCRSEYRRDRRAGDGDAVAARLVAAGAS